MSITTKERLEKWWRDNRLDEMAGEHSDEMRQLVYEFVISSNAETGRKACLVGIDVCLQRVDRLRDKYTAPTTTTPAYRYFVADYSATSEAAKALEGVFEELLDVRTNVENKSSWYVH